MPAAVDLRGGDEITTSRGHHVVVTDSPRPTAGGKLVIRWESTERTPNGMPRMEGIMLAEPKQEFEAQRPAAQVPDAA